MAIEIQTLESRVLFTAVTAAVLQSDQAAILADAATLKVDVKTLFGEDEIDTKLLALGFKALPKADQAFLKTLEGDSSKGGTFLTKDITTLVSGSVSLTKKSVAVGDSLLKKATISSLAAAEKDITALDTITAVPLSNLQTLLSSNKLEEDRDLILLAFPQDAAVINAITDEATNAAAGKSAIFTEAEQYQTDIGTLAADLTSVHTAVGTFPNLVGTFTGNVTETAGKNVGELNSVTLVFATENANTGKVTGTVTDQSSGGIDVVSGSVTLNGKLTLVIVPATGSKGTIAGQVDGSTIAGTVKYSKLRGIFAVTEVVAVAG